VQGRIFDFGGNLLVWQKEIDTGPLSSTIAELLVLDTTGWPAQPMGAPCIVSPQSVDYPPSANDGKVAFVREAPSNGREQIMICTGCSCVTETGDDASRGSENLAINVDTLVYNKSGLDALLYWDAPTNAEYLVAQPRAWGESARVDGNVVVWSGDAGGPLYALLRGVDVASIGISSQDDLSFGGSVVIDATLHNCPHRTTPGPIQVAAYDGHPHDGGILIDSESVGAMDPRQYLGVPLANEQSVLAEGAHKICVVAESSINSHGTNSGDCKPWLVGGNGTQLRRFAEFQNCFSGSCIEAQPGCAKFDYDLNQDVDKGDYKLLFPLFLQP